jgi:hypothetical protein
MKALILHNQVVDIEKRDINLYEYYHEDIAKLFVDCPDDTSIGDSYIDGKFEKPDDGGATE